LGKIKYDFLEVKTTGIKETVLKYTKKELIVGLML